MKNSLLNVIILVTLSCNFYFASSLNKKLPAAGQNFIAITYGGKSLKLTGNDVDGALSHTKQLGISGNHFENSTLVVVSVQPYKLGQTGTFPIVYPSNGTLIMVMENGQPILTTKGKIIINSATQNYVSGSFSGVSMDGKNISGTFASIVKTAESAGKSGIDRNQN